MLPPSITSHLSEKSSPCCERIDSAVCFEQRQAVQRRSDDADLHGLAASLLKVVPGFRGMIGYSDHWPRSSSPMV